VGEDIVVSGIPDPLPVVAHRSLPSGTITFAFTDIEGSTQRWERDQAAMRNAVRRHDALLRAAIDAHGGYVFKTIGDAFCASFWRPEDAVAAMLDAQRALASHDFSAIDGLRVRAAIHTGTADERDDDYFGPTVNRVARLLAIAAGGQVLLSGVTAELAGGVLPADAQLRDLGEHRLKDLARPENVFQLLAPGLPAEFPPLRSLDAFQHNLPRRLTPLLGREAETAEISALIAAHSLVTIGGSGGIGKTRTALEVGAGLLDGSGDGVWFIELAPLTHGEHIPTTIAAAMGIALGGRDDPLSALVAALKAKRALLIFDNCEHLIDACARIVARLLSNCPGVRVLATSRQGLEIAGEHVYRLPSLPLPSADEAATLTARDLPRFTALALFVERARAADQRFTPTDENAPVVAYICLRLDGIALAIELAAARLTILAPRQLRDRLDERFRLLTGGSRDLLPRQQTLRALIDWSFDLLDARERTVFTRIGIFTNGFTLEGAVAVAGDDDLDEFAVIDILASLVEKSLVLAQTQGDAFRYRLLESTRAYALERLATAERDGIAGRHLRFLHDRIASHFADAERTIQPAPWIEAFITEREDIRVALDGALARRDIIAGAELLAAIERIWSFVALDNEGITRIDAFVAALGKSDVGLRATLLGIAASILIESGRHARGREVAIEAVRVARACDDGPTLAAALVWFAASSIYSAEPASATAALAEVDTIAGLSARLQKSVLMVRAALSTEIGDFDTAAAVFEQMRDAARARGDERSEQISIFALAEVRHSVGRTREAIALIREILPAARRGTDTALVAYMIATFAGCLAADDDFAGAIEAGREAIALCASWDLQSPELTKAILYLALVAARLGDISRAALLAGYADITLTRSGTARSFSEKDAIARLGAILREQLPSVDLARLTAEGVALEPHAAIDIARGVTVP
jgi:predicted ATPase/class 3 adenylate cyclase